MTPLLCRSGSSSQELEFFTKAYTILDGKMMLSEIEDGTVGVAVKPLFDCLKFNKKDQTGVSTGGRSSRSI